ncbi:MAG: ribonucleoside-diphosphate reductase alpha chain, partial [Paraglaciecola sp.]
METVVKTKNSKKSKAVSSAKVETYAFKTALKASTEYFNGDELAANVWINKYALKDSNGNIYEKTPEDMHHRIASEIARIETKYKNGKTEEEIFALLKDFKYIVPQGSPMAGIGNNHQISSLSNCFVIGNGADSYGGIMRIDEEQAQLMKRRGGVGHDLSHIRPKGSPVMNSALSSTGIVPFMERYSNCTREVAQDGRRGALMLTVSSKHPDMGDFVDAKLELGKVTGANVSVKIDDEFMRAAMSNSTYKQQYPIKSDKPKFTKEVNAKELWDKMIHNAWKSAEPGMIFWDTVIKESVADCYADLGYETISTNPCGEIPLCPYDSCRLLAINLYSYVDQPFTKKAKFNFEKFGKHVQLAQRFMDDIIDLEIEKIEKIIAKIEK